jgi:threonine/homoserine/homoserine lactone efflux protein
MVVVFFVSVFAGFILGAPVGVAGALIADAALTHNRRRLELIVIAAVAGETILAYVTSFASEVIKRILSDYKYHFHIVSGILIIIIGIVLFVSTMRSHKGVMEKKDLHGASKWLLGHTAAPAAAFICNLIHPGSIIAFLFTVALLSKNIADFSSNNIAFAAGIMIGSGSVFSACALIFWKLRKKADKFVHFFRYGLAVIVGVFGIYLLLSNVL